MRPSEIVSRARQSTGVSLMTEAAAPAPVGSTARTPRPQGTVPPQIPPAVYAPSSASIYRRLMKNHDRMTPRHIP